MKKLRLACAGLIATVASMAVSAEVPEQPWRLGVYLGATTTDIDADYYDSGLDYTETVSDSNAFTLLVTGTYVYAENMAVEIQFGNTLGSDTIFGEVDTSAGDVGEMDLSTNMLGVYQVFRFGGEAYFEAKIGYGVATATLETANDSSSWTSGHLSWGFAVGQEIGGLGALELSFMRYPNIDVRESKINEDLLFTAGGSNLNISRDFTQELLSVGYKFYF